MFQWKSNYSLCHYVLIGQMLNYLSAYIFIFQTGRRAPSINNFRRKNVYLQLDFEYNYVCLRAIVVFMPVC